LQPEAATGCVGWGLPAALAVGWNRVAAQQEALRVLEDFLVEGLRSQAKA